MIDKLIEPVSDILDKFVVDKDLKTKLSHELQKELISLDKAQIALNSEEAKNRNWFVSGARPSILWICSFSLAVHYCVLPIATWIAVANGLDLKLEALEFDFSQLTTILLSLLGMSSLRTFEKTKGVHTK
tara:strand:+ start:16 stop:405 length:390 start_codon:yes stop_codon:yes gene_type:complete